MSSLVLRTVEIHPLFYQICYSFLDEISFSSSVARLEFIIIIIISIYLCNSCCVGLTTTVRASTQVLRSRHIFFAPKHCLALCSSSCFSGTCFLPASLLEASRELRTVSALVTHCQVKFSNRYTEAQCSWGKLTRSFDWGWTKFEPNELSWC